MLKFVDTKAEFEELCTTIRHYGNMRFLILPIYFAINGSMFIGLQNSTIKYIYGAPFLVFIIAAAIFICFFNLERTLNDYLEKFVCKSKEFENCFWSVRPDTGFRISYSIRLLYVLVLFVWVLFAYNLATASSPSSC